MKDHDRERKLRALLGEAHRADRPPSFRRTWDGARRMRATRGPVWALIPALAAAVLLILWSVRPRPGSPPAMQEIQTVQGNGEETPRLGFATPVPSIAEGLGATPRLRFATLGASGAFATLGVSGPLDFLLEMPGSELLHTVPNFDTDRSFP